jgi:CheY-like chemotaxis protein
VDSEPGKGSRFHFIAHFGRVLEDPRAHVEAPLRGRALVVDDLLEARLVLSRILEDLGMEVEHAENGEEALAMIAEALRIGRPFSSAFIDWVMPGMDGGALTKTIRARFGHRTPQVLVVSAYDTEELRQSIDRLDIKHFLPKPVLPAALQQILIDPRSNEARDWTGSADALASLAGMHVLVVEDQPINQQLVMELLANMEVTADLAQDGAQAISIVSARPTNYYALVLMDLQMPVLDGYETTKRLRADPRYAGLPIVAMTAHVTYEEREQCAALGMRGHLGKPIDPDELRRLVASFYPGRLHTALSQTLTAKHDVENNAHIDLKSLPGLDVSAGLRHTAGKESLYRSLLKQFCVEFDHFSDRTQSMLAAGRIEDAGRLAHSLKGVAANLGATETAETAAALEKALKAGQDHASVLATLDLHLVSLIRALQQHFDVTASSLNVSEPSDRPQGSTEPAPPWMNELMRLLKEGDIAAQQLWAQRSEELRARLPPQTFTQVRRALENFDFDNALVALGRH